MTHQILRTALVDVLEGGQAHVSLERALRGLKARARHTTPAARLPSVWEQLEHMRIAQADILQYTRDPDWESPPWPAGYWPPPTDRVTKPMWDATVGGFAADLRAVIDLVRDPACDLLAPLPHAPQHTTLRECLLIADHNAYHLGQIVQARKLLGDWRG